MSQRGAYSPAVARTPAQRGKVGNWLVESRLARGWDTQEKARAEIARLTGWKVPQSVYAEWESGRRLPSDTNLDKLRGFYGDAPGATETPDDLVAVLSAQARAIAALVEEVRAERQARVAWEQGFLEAMRELAKAAMQQDGPEHVPRAGLPR